MMDHDDDDDDDGGDDDDDDDGGGGDGDNVELNWAVWLSLIRFSCD